MRFFYLLSFSVLAFTSCVKKKAPAEQAGQSDHGNTVLFEFIDFESVSDGRVDSTKGVAGKICGKLNDQIEYGYGFERQIGKLSSYKSIEEVNINFNCFMDKKTDGDVFVFSVEDTTAKKSIYWEAKGITPEKTGTWSPININFKINKEHLNPAYIIKLYPWNKGKNTYYYDDLSFSFEQAKK
ncbi:MAG: hypothetical protein K0Q95_2202 [Bacteroidota bacterium]|jgi:hypothetical protein|nr:hypothetical protein [Bacteroidota bacterium]